MKNKAVFITLIAILLAIVTSTAALAVELSADMVISGMVHTSTGKIFIKDKLARFESTQAGFKQINIMRGDKKVTWMLNEKDKTYWEMKHPDNNASMLANPSDWEKAMLKLGTKKKIGTEKVNGYDCDKYLFIYHDKNKGTQTMWISKKLKIMIKVMHQIPNGGAITTEYKNIKVGNQPMSLFEIPKGYKKSQMPSMPRGLEKKGGMPPGIGKRMR